MSIPINPGNPDAPLPELGKRVRNLELLLSPLQVRNVEATVQGRGPTLIETLVREIGTPDPTGGGPFTPVGYGTTGIAVKGGRLKRGDTGEMIFAQGAPADGIVRLFGAQSGNLVYLIATIDAASFVPSQVFFTIGRPWEGYPRNAIFGPIPPYPQIQACLELGRISMNPDRSIKVENQWSSGNIVLAQSLLFGRLCWTFQPGN